jgi:hypothetical protein
MSTYNKTGSTYKNIGNGIVLTDKFLTIGDYSVALGTISEVFYSEKKKSIWQGILFLIWGALVFWNDTLPQALNSEPNNPLFKFTLIGIGISWFIYRYLSKTKINVSITTGGRSVLIAITHNWEMAEKIATEIKKSI